MLAGNNHNYSEELCFLISKTGKLVWHTDCSIYIVGGVAEWVQNVGFDFVRC